MRIKLQDSRYIWFTAPGLERYIIVREIFLSESGTSVVAIVAVGETHVCQLSRDFAGCREAIHEWRVGFDVNLNSNPMTTPALVQALIDAGIATELKI